MLRTLIAAVAVIVLLGGCRSGPSSTALGPELAPDPRTLLLADGQTASPLSWPGLIARAAEADVVLVGEMHGQAAGQAFEAALFEDLLSAAPGAVAALEFYERDQQVALDDFLAGVTTEAQFRRAAGRAKDDPGHAAMIELSKARSRPVIAANAPRRYVRLARLEGYERLAALKPEQRRLFRIPDQLPGGRYREEFDRLMAPEEEEPDAHGSDADEPPTSSTAPNEQTEAMFRAQSLWDWTMADSVAAHLGAHPDDRPVVLIVGKFHIDHDGGLVQALRSIAPGRRVVTVTMTDEAGPFETGIADVVVNVGESQAPAAGAAATSAHR